MCVRERDSVCVGVVLRERDGVCVGVCARERDGVCVGVCERERHTACVVSVYNTMQCVRGPDYVDRNLYSVSNKHVNISL